MVNKPTEAGTEVGQFTRCQFLSGDADHRVAIEQAYDHIDDFTGGACSDLQTRQLHSNAIRKWSRMAVNAHNPGPASIISAHVSARRRNCC